VAELYDEKLFKDHPPPEDCPICFLPLPLDDGQVTFEACCGKSICNGCIIAMNEREGAKLCAFCRTPCAQSEEEYVKRIMKLMEKGTAIITYGKGYGILSACRICHKIGQRQMLGSQLRLCAPGE